MKAPSGFAVSPLRRQIAETLRRARKLPPGRIEMTCANWRQDCCSFTKRIRLPEIRNREGYEFQQ